MHQVATPFFPSVLIPVFISLFLPLSFSSLLPPTLAPSCAAKTLLLNTGNPPAAPRRLRNRHPPPLSYWYVLFSSTVPHHGIPALHRPPSVAPHPSSIRPLALPPPPLALARSLARKLRMFLIRLHLYSSTSPISSSLSLLSRVVFAVNLRCFLFPSPPFFLSIFLPLSASSISTPASILPLLYPSHACPGSSHFSCLALSQPSFYYDH